MVGEEVLTAIIRHNLKNIIWLFQEPCIMTKDFPEWIIVESEEIDRCLNNSKVIESILFDYTDDVVEKDDILGYYNLYENPTFVLIKGNARICFAESAIELSEMPGGIALSNGSLAGIHKISVKADKVITVENLTTYHDCDELDAVYIYLGGYHNTSKQRLLELIYEKTIERFYRAGLYKTLTARDRKMIDSKKDGQLSAYKDVLEYMLAFDCKVEQESIKAVELIERQ